MEMASAYVEHGILRFKALLKRGDARLAAEHADGLLDRIRAKRKIAPPPSPQVALPLPPPLESLVEGCPLSRSTDPAHIRWNAGISVRVCLARQEAGRSTRASGTYEDGSSSNVRKRGRDVQDGHCLTERCLLGAEIKRLCGGEET